MIALILAWALAGDAWATQAVQRIGGPVHSIWIDAKVYGDAWDAPLILTLEKLDAGLIDAEEATQENIRNIWPENFQ